MLVWKFAFPFVEWDKKIKSCGKHILIRQDHVYRNWTWSSATVYVFYQISQFFSLTFFWRMKRLNSIFVHKDVALDVDFRATCSYKKFTYHKVQCLEMCWPSQRLLNIFFLLLLTASVVLPSHLNTPCLVLNTKAKLETNIVRSQG